MIEALYAVAGAFIGMELGRFLTVKIERDRHDATLAAEQRRVADLTTLLMSREAPAEYAAYLEPQSLAEAFPEDALWDESGLYYTTGSED